ncbi:MAG: hypothetical protein P8J37_09630 [Fuerstiella sp.]|nr:hypothetical protein [Fuerstiella sp.]
MSEISIFIFGMFVFAVAIASSLIAAIGTWQPKPDIDPSKRPTKDADALV